MKNVQIGQAESTKGMKNKLTDSGEIFLSVYAESINLWLEPKMRRKKRHDDIGQTFRVIEQME